MSDNKNSIIRKPESLKSEGPIPMNVDEGGDSDGETGKSSNDR